MAKIGAYAVHPAADKFPLFTDEELKELEDSIADMGQLQPITIDANGVLLDGRNRLKVLLKLGITPKKCVWRGTDKVDFIVATNLTRRHLTPDQKAIIFARLSDDWKAEAEAAMQAGRRKGGQTAGRGRLKKDDSSGGASPTRPIERDDSQRSVAKAAKAAGLPENTIRRARTVVVNDPELAAKVADGKMTLTVASKKVAPKVEAKNPKPPKPPKTDAQIKREKEVRDQEIVLMNAKSVVRQIDTISWRGLDDEHIKEWKIVSEAIEQFVRSHDKGRK